MPKQRKRHTMPDDVREALPFKSPLDTYRARPPYQQNDYLGWIMKGVRAETRTKRIAQMLDELRRGNVYMKMKWGAAQRAMPGGSVEAKRTGRKTPARGKKSYNIKRAGVWVYPGAAAWHFVTLPEKRGAGDKKYVQRKCQRMGFDTHHGDTGKTTWKTSIFPDGKTDSYLLPLKKEVRKKETIPKDGRISFRLVVG